MGIIGKILCYIIMGFCKLAMIILLIVFIVGLITSIIEGIYNIIEDFKIMKELQKKDGKFRGFRR